MNSVSDKLMMEKPEKSESKKDLSPRDPKVYVGVCAMAERENWKDILMVLKKNPFVIHLFDLNKVNVPFQKTFKSCRLDFSDVTPLKAINLNELTIISVLESSKHSFKITDSNNNSYLFRCQKEKDLQSWIPSLTNKIS